MPLSVGTALVLLSVVVLAKKYWDNYKVNPKRLPFPPGPKGLPIVGNLFDVPKTQPWLKYASWSKVHGEHLPYKFLYTFALPLPRRLCALSCLQSKHDRCEFKEGC